MSHNQDDPSPAADIAAPTAAGSDQGFSAAAASRGLRRVWELAAPDLPREIEPFSFVSAVLLRHVAQGPGSFTRTDAHRSRMRAGGPGLWLAREADVWLVGVDFSSVAADQAAHRAALFGLGNRARFVVGDLISTALPDASAAAAVPIERPQRAHGAELLGEVAQYQSTFRLCCPRGQHRRPAGTTQLTRASRK